MAINLQKGQRIDLRKSNGLALNNICVGVNWGAIETTSWLFFKKTEAVDLDASCILYNANKEPIDIVYFGKLLSNDNAIKHSGDDLTGDVGGDDGLDNEVITLDFPRLNKEVEYIAFVLNSFRGHNFGIIPFASIRIYEGTPTRVNDVLAVYNIAKEAGFERYTSMVMGVFYKKNDEWKFNAIGEPTIDSRLEQTITTVQQKYL